MAPDKVAAVVKDLWFQAIERVKEHVEHFDRLTGRRWRIGNIEFGLPERGGDRQTMKGACVLMQNNFGPARTMRGICRVPSA